MKKRYGFIGNDPDNFYKHFITSGGGLTAVYTYRDNLIRRATAYEKNHPEKKTNWLLVPIREGSSLIDFLS